MKKSLQKRIYTATDGEYILAYVAANAKEARKMAFAHDLISCSDIQWIDFSVKWHKGVDASELPFGELNEVKGLELGVYYCLYERDCEGCKKNCKTLYWDEKIKAPRCSGCNSEKKSEY